MPEYEWRCGWHDCDEPRTALAMISSHDESKTYLAVYTGKIYRHVGNQWEMAYFRQEIVE